LVKGYAFPYKPIKTINGFSACMARTYWVIHQWSYVPPHYGSPDEPTARTQAGMLLLDRKIGVNARVVIEKRKKAGDPIPYE
jgi:hypothetical protein